MAPPVSSVRGSVDLSPRATSAHLDSSRVHQIRPGADGLDLARCRRSRGQRRSCVARGRRVARCRGRLVRAWDVPVLDSDADALSLAESQGLRLIVTIGDNRRRLKVLDLVPPALRWSAAALTSTVASDVPLGDSTVVMHHAHVGPGARVGRGVIINTAAIVEHDATVGDGVHVAPGAVILGGACIDEAALIGSGAGIIPGVASEQMRWSGRAQSSRETCSPGRASWGSPRWSSAQAMSAFMVPGRLTVIAEASINHNGDEALAHKLIDVAARSGADAVKFQTFDPAALVSEHAKTTTVSARPGRSCRTSSPCSRR